MEIEYKKDLMHNYMVITEKDYKKIEPYILKILENQVIEGLLPITHRLLDNKLLFYYEITAKQSMKYILDKAALTYDKVKQLCATILQTLERTYDYLLPEEDYMISPEFIYIDVITFKPSLCYYPGYGGSINKQMNCLMEYLMNKVDYNDKEAVLLVYQLYAVTREDGFNFYRFKEVLKEDTKTNGKDSTVANGKQKTTNEKTVREANSRVTIGEEIYAEDIKLYKSNDGINYESKETGNIKAIKDNGNSLEMPVMMERIEGEKEVSCYSLRTYLYTVGCILGGILIIALAITTKLLYNTFGNQIDYSKLFALLLIVGCTEGYLLKKILDKKYKITKMIKTCDYIDPTKDGNQQGDSESNKQRKVDKKQKKSQTVISRQTNKMTEKPIKADQLSKINIDSNFNIEKAIPSDRLMKEKEYFEDTFNKKTITSKEVIPAEDDFNPTCLLNPMSEKKQLLMLKALDETSYMNITLVSFPFFIGKLKKNVDYCLDKDVVSRFHAKITQEDNAYFLMDLNSTNGTFINQQPLITYQKKEIKFGDEISFADIRYQFSKE